MTENKNSKMNLEQERRIAELQERVNRLENLCYAAKEILKLIEWVRGAKSMSVEEIKEEAAAKIMEMNERQ